MGDQGGARWATTAPVRTAALVALLGASLLGCASNGWDFEASRPGEESIKTKLGLSRTGADAYTVVVPSCMDDTVERIAVFGPGGTLWDVRALSATALPASFVIGEAPPGFLTTTVKFATTLEPTTQYRLVAGDAPDENESTPSTVTPSTVTPSTGGPRPTSGDTTAETFLAATALADFRPEEITSETILVDGEPFGQAEFDGAACPGSADVTTTTVTTG